MNAPTSRAQHLLHQQHTANSNGNESGDHWTGNATGPPHHRLTPQEAALRGASLAFQKQQQQESSNGTNGNGRVSRQTTGNGGVSRHTTGSSTRHPDDTERERERQALFLPPVSSAAADQQGKSGPTYLSPLGGGRANAATDPKSASFIAATLAASRSVSPGTVPGGLRGENNGAAGASMRRSPLRGPADISRRGSVDDVTDTTSLAPATSLISLFESQRRGEASPVRRSPNKPTAARKQKLRSSRSAATLGRENDGLDRASTTRSESRPPETWSKPKPSPKPKPKLKSKVTTRAVTPPPPVVRRADTEIVSPKPRRPETKHKWEEDAAVSIESNEPADAPVKVATKPKSPKPRTVVPRESGGRENQTTKQRESVAPITPTTPIKTRPPTPRKSVNLAGRTPLEVKQQNARRRSEVSNTDGQEESRLLLADDTAATDARPATSDSKSSNDSFVSASSAPTRDETDSLLTVGPPTPTPKGRSSRPVSTQPPTPTPALPIRRSVTGSSQLPLDSLSDAIMAGSLASARHTPMPTSDTRTPPPRPPSRRKGVGGSKNTSRRSSPHRLKHTLRQPASVSDDEDARRPHHHRSKGLHSKKHAHHEGSRRRWRDEITEREKKRYEALWASNRGLFLVPTRACSDAEHHPAAHLGHTKPRRDEQYEVLSEHVANVVVRDLWTRSRLPPAELAEVWDLVCGRGHRPLSAESRRVPNPVHGALNKQEFVVGMWLIDQRLRGRKIPHRVSESVWDSAIGWRVLTPDHGHGHGQKRR